MFLFQPIIQRFQKSLILFYFLAVSYILLLIATIIIFLKNHTTNFESKQKILDLVILIVSFIIIFIIFQNQFMVKKS